MCWSQVLGLAPAVSWVEGISSRRSCLTLCCVTKLSSASVKAIQQNGGFAAIGAIVSSLHAFFLRQFLVSMVDYLFDPTVSLVLGIQEIHTDQEMIGKISAAGQCKFVF